MSEQPSLCDHDTIVDAEAGTEKRGAMSATPGFVALWLGRAGPDSPLVCGKDLASSFGCHYTHHLL
jgi:hypothetical protein